MKRQIFASAVFGFLVLAPMCNLRAQVESPVYHRSMSFQLELSYEAMHAQFVGGGGFGMAGASAAIVVPVHRNLGLVFDGAETRRPAVLSAEAGIDLLTVAGGVRYSETRMDGRWVFYGQGLGGRARGSHSEFACGIHLCTSAGSVEMEAGYGVNLRLSPTWMLHAVQVDWVFTGLPNGSSNTQNSVRLSTGIAMNFH